MSDPDEPTADREHEGDGEYEVGYGKPPREHQFHKGISGNYAGRPRKPAAASSSDSSAVDPVVAEARRKIKVREGDREIEVTAQAAVMRAQFMSSIKGNATAQREYLRFTQRALTEEAKRKDRLFQHAYRYRAYWRDARERLKAEGRKLPADVINPDWIRFDKDLNVRILGPLSRGDLRFYQKLQKHYEDEIEELAYMRNLVREDPNLAKFYAPHMKRATAFIKFLKPHVECEEIELLDI